MNIQDDAFLQRLRATFRLEAEEHLQALSARLLELENHPRDTQQTEDIEAVFRHAHSLKGAARAVNLSEIESVCQRLESFFAAWKRREVGPAPEHFDVLHRAIDLISKSIPGADGKPRVVDQAQVEALTWQLAELGGSGQAGRTQSAGEKRPAPPAGVDVPVESLDAPRLEAPIATDSRGATPGASSPEPSPTVPEKPAIAQTVRISTDKLDLLLLEAEEMLSVKLGTAQRAASLRELQATFERWKTEWARIQPQVRELQRLVRPPLAPNDGAFGRSPQASLDPSDNTVALPAPVRDSLPDVLEFLEWNLTHHKSLESKLQGISKHAAQDQISVARRVDDLLANTKQLVMLPFSTLLDLFPKLVRDLSREQGKEVALVISGSDVEIDKRILERMKDALIHLVRNCIDHGIEKPEIRVQHGKPPQATLTVSVSQVDGSGVEILVADDGAGIDLEKVKAAAVRQGTLSSSSVSQLDDQQALTLIFQSEVSTSPIITEISGRGLGLAIVREETERLAGQITVETHRQAGTTFRINLPSTLAILRGVLVQTADQRFVIPTAHVERVARIRPDEIKTVENRETIVVGGHPVSLARLEDALELSGPSINAEALTYLSVVILGTAEERIAFVVDEVLREEEVLVKTLSKPLSRVRNIAGATILGAGKAVAVLNVLDLMKSARRPGLKPLAPAQSTADGTQQTRRKRILVAEDSITSRMLLKNILESAGYEVRTAVDGVEALTELRTGDFDLVVSDIEMPRMNGFDLTAHIRTDRKLAEKPVILVTALSSREDRERGIDVGANAYIVKSSFDQSNLLDAVRRLA